MLAYIGLCICLDCNSCIYCYIVKDDCTHSCLADLHGYQRRALRRSYVTLMCGTQYFLYAAALRRGGGIEPLHVSMPRELKSRSSTSPTHLGKIRPTDFTIASQLECTHRLPTSVALQPRTQNLSRYHRLSVQSARAELLPSHDLPCCAINVHIV